MNAITETIFTKEESGRPNAAATSAAGSVGTILGMTVRGISIAKEKMP
jgi:hypothetical protein